MSKIKTYLEKNKYAPELNNLVFYNKKTGNIIKKLNAYLHMKGKHIAKDKNKMFQRGNFCHCAKIRVGYDNVIVPDMVNKGKTFVYNEKVKTVATGTFTTYADLKKVIKQVKQKYDLANIFEIKIESKFVEMV